MALSRRTPILCPPSVVIGDVTTFNGTPIVHMHPVLGKPNGTTMGHVFELELRWGSVTVNTYDTLEGEAGRCVGNEGDRSDAMTALPLGQSEGVFYFISL
jgi:hypothetical protein